MKLFFQRLAGLPLLSIFLSFTAIQAAQMLLPLLALPWLARVLGPDSFGLLMYFMTISMACTAFMDWGFGMGAVRETAQHRGSLQCLSSIASGVMTAKLLLALVAAAIAALACLFMPLLRLNASALVLAMLLGIVQGMNPLWFFQGLGQGMKRAAAYDCISGLGILAGMALLIRTPEDWSLYLACTLGCKTAAYIPLSRRMGRLRLDAAGACRRIWELRGLCCIRLMSMCNTQGLMLILGTVLPMSQMGQIIVCDKIVRGVVSLANPLSQTLFPELCAARHRDSVRARIVLQKVLVGLLTVTAISAVALALTSPWLVPLLLGGNYAASIALLPIFCLLIPLLTCNSVLSMQAFVSAFEEGSLLRIMAATCLPLLAAAPWLAEHFGAVAGAWIPVSGESAMLLAMLWYIWRHAPHILFLAKGDRP